MSEDLNEELKALRSIYGDEVLQMLGSNDYVLCIPDSQPSRAQVSLRLHFPYDYPASSPQILGTESTGEQSKKGHGKYVTHVAKMTLEKVYTPGFVCLFDLLQELEVSLGEGTSRPDNVRLTDLENHRSTNDNADLSLLPEVAEIPEWILSEPVTERKSVFLARVCNVKSPQQAKAFVAHFLSTDKRAAKATHNITAYRIRSPATTDFRNEISYEDCDDDGESAAGGRLLHLLQLMNVWDVLVVVSRWYGGVKLGPDRFSIISNVAREAVLRGGWTARRKAKG